jgi:hypothetical protein
MEKSIKRIVASLIIGSAPVNAQEVSKTSNAQMDINSLLTHWI